MNITIIFRMWFMSCAERVKGDRIRKQRLNNHYVIETVVPTASVYAPAPFAATSPNRICPDPRNTVPDVVQTLKYVTDCEADRPVTATAPLRAREPLDAAANVAADMPDPRALDVPADPGSPECSRIASIVIASSIVFLVAVENPMTTP